MLKKANSDEQQMFCCPQCQSSRGGGFQNILIVLFEMKLQIIYFRNALYITITTDLRKLSHY